MKAKATNNNDKTGIELVVEAYQQELDMSLLEENLKLSPHQRVEQLARQLQAAEELRRAGERLRGNR